MIDGKRLVEIERRRGQAQFGYGVMGNREYAQDVGELLGELQSLRVQLEDVLKDYRRLGEELEDRLDKLQRENEELPRHVADLQDQLRGVCEDDFDASDSVEQAIAAPGDRRYYLEGKPRCQKEPGGEQCGLVEGHEGGCKWLGGD